MTKFLVIGDIAAQILADASSKMSRKDPGSSPPGQVVQGGVKQSGKEPLNPRPEPENRPSFEGKGAASFLDARTRQRRFGP